MKNLFKKMTAVLLSAAVIISMGSLIAFSSYATSGDYTGDEIDLICYHVNTQVINIKTENCGEDGYTGDIYCLDCKDIISKGEIIPAAGVHTVGDWLSNSGGHWHVCTVCQQEIDKTKHTYTWSVIEEATAEEAGLKEEVCSVCGYKSGVIEPVEYVAYTPGDINSDGEVDNLDVIALFQYVSDWGNEVNTLALDVNGDGDVDNLDVIALFQYVSDWGNEIY